ncbi:MAG TPA: PAS domain-containing sensor histidine kinase [Coxiellaceae bacterium]|nr:PAS domain-containing sensor histidine kinase [Coxiellaceae bacterium]
MEFSNPQILQECFYNLPNYLFLKNRDFVYQLCNYNFARSFGFNGPSEVIGKTDFEMPWDKESAKVYREEDEQIIEKGSPILQKEVTMRFTQDDKARVLLISKTPLMIDKEVVAILGIYIDITELKNAQQEAEEAKAKAAAEEATKRALLIFSGMSTHDIRTPLSSINLRAAFLKKYLPALDESYKAADAAGLDIPHIQTKVLADLQQAPLDILQALKEANDYIDSSLKSLKSASQGEELINKEQLTDCNAERLLRRIVDSYPYKDNQASLLHYNPENDFNFKGNVIFFNRLVENLIKNAFEQIELKGRGEIFISCAQENQSNLIKIKDTAGGVTQEIINKLFIGVKSTKEGGTGIGLSSAKQIMQGMNGDIKAYLVDGDCIEFVLSFPVL